MKIAIIQFPGSNCERETILAVKRAGIEPVEFLWNEPHERLREFDGYIIVGGFSYEDRSRAGILASLDPIMPIVRKEGASGKPILGICNGAQILVETGMVPGVRNNVVAMALAVNTRIKGGTLLGTGFYNGWANVQLAVPSESNAFSRRMLPGEFMRIPVAHGEGRFLMTDELLSELVRKNLTAFRYCDEAGKTREDFPVNPNGALYNLAAVTNPAGNIMAIMPHPERSPEGDRIFSSMREYIEDRVFAPAPPLEYEPTPYKIQPYAAPQSSSELLIDLIITDNEAMSVQNALRHLGINATITRQTHWEITGTSRIAAVQAIGELYNSNKEKVISHSTQASTISLLVRAKDDYAGQAKKDTLTNHLGITGIDSLHKGVLWNITTEDGKIEEIVSRILDTHILFNPFSQECFRYQ